MQWLFCPCFFPMWTLDFWDIEFFWYIFLVAPPSMLLFHVQCCDVAYFLQCLSFLQKHSNNYVRTKYNSVKTSWALRTCTVITSLLKFLKTNWDKIFNATVESICFQDKISVILTTCLEVETYIKGHHIYKKISTPEFRKQLNVQTEPDNRVYKFVGCIKIYLKDLT